MARSVGVLHGSKRLSIFGMPPSAWERGGKVILQEIIISHPSATWFRVFLAYRRNRQVVRRMGCAKCIRLNFRNTTWRTSELHDEYHTKNWINHPFYGPGYQIPESISVGSVWNLDSSPHKLPKYEWDPTKDQNSFHSSPSRACHCRCWF